MNKFHAYVICHSQFAFSLIETVESIFGKQSQITAISNKNKTVPSLIEEIKKNLELNQHSIPVFFVDLKGGSCWMACKKIMRELKGSLLITGVNIPMLIQFVNKSESLESLELLKEVLINDAIKSISGEIL
jgi:mannose/fructose-specific phosphotransferase system component IIA